MSIKTIFTTTIILIGLLFSFASIYALQAEKNEKSEMNTKNKDLETATFGAGCFWCVEAVFQRVKGVKAVVSGYSGGHIQNPAYREVTTGNTGHAEVVQIKYNPELIDFASLLKVFWGTHDPTTLNRQGADHGTQYRSVIFYHDQNQKKLAEKYKKELDESGAWDSPVVTEISPFEVFYEAEAEHQNYYKNNPEQGYCAYVIRPKLEKFEAVFEHKLRK